MTESETIRIANLIRGINGEELLDDATLDWGSVEAIEKRIADGAVLTLPRKGSHDPELLVNFLREINFSKAISKETFAQLRFVEIDGMDGAYKLWVIPSWYQSNTERMRALMGMVSELARKRGYRTTFVKGVPAYLSIWVPRASN